MRKLLIVSTAMSILLAVDHSCLVCHKDIYDGAKTEGFENFHQIGSMMSEVAEVAKKIDEPSCTICHGGNSRTYDITKVHKGAPTKHPGGLKIFVKNPETSKTANKKVCALCHNLGSL